MNCETNNVLMPCSSPSPESGSEGGFFRSCSNASSCGDSYSTFPPLKEEGEKKKLAELFEDAYWIDQVDNGTKLVDLFQDECWSKEFAPVHLTDPSIENTNLKSKQENNVHSLSLKKPNYSGGKNSNHCCFPRRKEIQ